MNPQLREFLIKILSPFIVVIITTFSSMYINNKLMAKDIDNINSDIVKITNENQRKITRVENDVKGEIREVRSVCVEALLKNNK